MRPAALVALALVGCVTPPRGVAPTARSPRRAATAPVVSARGVRFANGATLHFDGARVTWTLTDGSSRTVRLAPGGRCVLASWGASVAALCGRILRLTEDGRALVVPGPGGDATAFADERSLVWLSLSDDGEHAIGAWPCTAESPANSLCARDAGGAWRDLRLPDATDDAALCSVTQVRGAEASLVRSVGDRVERWVVDLDSGAAREDASPAARDASATTLAESAAGSAVSCASIAAPSPSPWRGARITRGGAVRVAGDGASARWWGEGTEGEGRLDGATSSLASLLGAAGGGLVVLSSFSDARFYWLDGARSHPLADLDAHALTSWPSAWSTRPAPDGLVAWVARDNGGELIRFGADGAVRWRREVHNFDRTRLGLAHIAGRWGWATWRAPGPVRAFTLDDAGQVSAHTIPWDGAARACAETSASAEEVTWVGCGDDRSCLLAPGGDEQQTWDIRAEGLCLRSVAALTTLAPAEAVTRITDAPGDGARRRVYRVEAAGDGTLRGFVDDGDTRAPVACHFAE